MTHAAHIEKTLAIPAGIDIAELLKEEFNSFHEKSFKYSLVGKSSVTVSGMEYLVNWLEFLLGKIADEKPKKVVELPFETFEEANVA